MSGSILLNSQVYSAFQHHDTNLTTRLLARAIVVKNRPRIIIQKQPEILEVLPEEEEFEDTPQQDTVEVTISSTPSLAEVERLIRKTAQGLREGYDPEMCAITLERVLALLADI